MRRQKINIAAEVYGLHFEELSALQQKHLLEIIASKSLDADELNNTPSDVSDEELDRTIKGNQ